VKDSSFKFFRGGGMHNLENAPTVLKCVLSGDTAEPRHRV